MVKKYMKRVLSISGNKKGDGGLVGMPMAPVPVKDHSRRNSLPLELSLPDGGVPKPTKGRRRQTSLRKQQKEKIQQFLKQGSFARRTWNGVPGPNGTLESNSSSSISLSSDDETNDMDSSNMTAPARCADSRFQGDRLLGPPLAREAMTTERMPSSGKIRVRSSNDLMTMVKKAAEAEAKAKRAMAAKKKVVTEKPKPREPEEPEPEPEEPTPPPPPPVVQKSVRWDAFVEHDQKKRELTRQFRSAIPDWKQRQMAHRVHLCNARKKELEVFKREFLEAEKRAECEFEVAPAADGWFERNDRDISAEFLMMDVDLFGNHKDKKNRAPRSVASF